MAAESAQKKDSVEREETTPIFLPTAGDKVAPHLRVTSNGNGSERRETLTLVPKRSRCAVSVREDDTDRWGVDDLDDKEEYILGLKDPNVRIDLLERLATFRRNRELCDCVLFVREREIFAHKVVLAAVSPALFDMFIEDSEGAENATATAVARSQSQSMGDSSPPAAEGTNGQAKEQQQQQQPGCTTPTASMARSLTSQNSRAGNKSALSFFEFEQTDYECFEALVNFAYTSSLEISSKKVAELYKTAYSLRMMPVVKACANYLADNLCIANCIGIRKQANFSGDIFLMDKVDNFIFENVDSIVEESVEFAALPCIKTRVIVNLEEVSGAKQSTGSGLAERALQYFAEWQRKNPQCEHPLEQLLSKTHMLYMEEDKRLADCVEMDESSSVGSCEMIQDYKKSKEKNVNTLPPPDVVGAPPVQHRVTGATPVRMSNACRATKGIYSSTESLDSVCSTLSESEELVETRLLAVHQTSEQFWVALVVLCRRIVAISLQLTDGEELAKNEKPNGSVHNGSAIDPQKASLLAKLVSCTGTARTPLPSMHEARCSVGAAFVHGKVIVCGGYDRGECLRSVEEYDVTLGEWKDLPNMKQERGRFDATVLDGKVYAIAGSDGNHDLRGCEVFNPKMGIWTKMKSLDKPRSHNGCATLDGYVYTIGGISDQKVLGDCERYDPSKDAWENVAPLGIPRYQCGVLTWRGFIIAVGGCDKWNCCDAVEAYDPKTNSWRKLCKLRTARRGCAVGVHRDMLFVMGGNDGTQSLTSVEILDQLSGTWRPGPSLTSPRANTRAITTAAGVIYVLGGFNGNQFLNTFELLENETTGWRNWLQRTTTSIREEEEGDQEDASFSRKAADSIGPGQPAQPDLQAETQRLPSAV